jgi:hypothetical protein
MLKHDSERYRCLSAFSSKFRMYTGFTSLVVILSNFIRLVPKTNVPVIFSASLFN